MNRRRIFLYHEHVSGTNLPKLEQAHRRAVIWARTHRSRFSPAKYQLIYFTRPRTRFNVTETVKVEDTEVQPTRASTYLGITLDAALRWDEQIKQVQRKATPLLTPLTTLAGSTWGAGLTQLRRIYQAAVIPAILYGCSAWYTLGTDNGHRQTRLQILNQIHRRAARAITGAFRATATTAMNIETHLLPMQQLLEKRLMESLLMVQTSKAADLIRKAHSDEIKGQGYISRCWRPWDWSPLQRIRELFSQKLEGKRLEDLESIHPFIVAPYWTPPEVVIDENAEIAMKQHETTRQDQSVTAVYTDGSGINGRVGAAAVCPQCNETRSVYMGEQSEATVYAAELQGILLALIIILRRQIQHAIIFTDNQAALRALQNPGRQSGQYILETILVALEKTRQHNLIIRFRWIPSHRGIDGNEQADTAAKEATGWRQVSSRRDRKREVMTNDTAPRPAHQRLLKTAMKSLIRETVNAQWEHDWRSSPHGRRVYELTPTPTKKVLRVHQGLHRALSTAIIQLRTGKIGLRHFLYQRGVPNIPDADCQCGKATQTVQHVLLACPLLKSLREEIFGRRLGGPDGEGSLKKILTTPKLAIRAAKFMVRTGLLGQFGAVDREEIDQAEH
jgi:ribonuclease HI